jgi:alkylated DNA repair dioxygenase AlkB
VRTTTNTTATTATTTSRKMWPPPPFLPRHYPARHHASRIPTPWFPSPFFPPFFHPLIPRTGFPRAPIHRPAPIASPAIIINQHFHYHGEKHLAEPGEKESLPNNRTESQAKEKDKVQEEVVAEAEFQQAEEIDVEEGNFQDDLDEVLEEEVAKEVEVEALEGETPPKRKLGVASATLSPTKKRQKQVAYSNTGFTSLLSMTGVTAMPGERVIARSRRWSAESNSFGDWTIHNTKRNSQTNDSIDFVLHRGGVIKFFPNLVEHANEVKNEMMCITTYKQYKVRECGSEPRLHALYCSSKGGYQYGRVKMASHPLESLPVISGVAEGLASKFGLLNDHWNIGCHLLLYRDGKDSIHWHADDTQGEDVVLSLTVDGPVADARTICFQPSNTTTLKTGDEQLELYPIPGDGYSMDGAVQSSYVHAMLKTSPLHVDTTGRMAIIFRNGIHKVVEDNGCAVTTLVAPQRQQYIFGNMCEELEEGKCYSRDFLFNSQAHRNGHGNIAGNKDVGCASLIVCKLSRSLDDDQFHFLTYVVGDASRPKTLLRSFASQQPVRVFRSSKGNHLKSDFLPHADGNKVLYRYDGVYYVIAAMDKEHHNTIVPRGGHVMDARVFYLIRAEPQASMRKLMEEHRSLRYFLPLFEKETDFDFSVKGSEELTGRAWDVNNFHDWNPLTIRI